MSAPIAPPSKPIIDLCGRIRAIALWLDGPRQEARVSSPRLAMTILVLTETPDPELEPSEAERENQQADVEGGHVEMSGYGSDRAASLTA